MKHTEYVCRKDLMIARTDSGKKHRIGEGSTGVVYKAFMHGDEVAVKMVRAANPGRKELLIFRKEVRQTAFSAAVSSRQWCVIWTCSAATLLEASM